MNHNSIPDTSFADKRQRLPTPKRHRETCLSTANLPFSKLSKNNFLYALDIYKLALSSLLNEVTYRKNNLIKLQKLKNNMQYYKYISKSKKKINKQFNRSNLYKYATQLYYILQTYNTTDISISPAPSTLTPTDHISLHSPAAPGKQVALSLNYKKLPYSPKKYINNKKILHFPINYLPSALDINTLLKLYNKCEYISLYIPKIIYINVTNFNDYDISTLFPS